MKQWAPLCWSSSEGTIVLISLFGTSERTEPTQPVSQCVEGVRVWIISKKQDWSESFLDIQELKRADICEK